MAKTQNIMGLFETTQRHIRTEVNGETIADSRNAYLMREHSYELQYYFPFNDVNMDILIETDVEKKSGRRGVATVYNVQVGDQLVEEAAWIYHNEPLDDRPDLREFVAFDWHKMDKWFEEAEEVIIHPRDPYHRIDTIKSNRHVQVEVDGVIVADTTDAVFLFETELPARYYIPEKDVKMEYLTATDLSTGCPYKGFASYWNIDVKGQTHENLVWGYKNPLYEAGQIENLYSFYNEKLTIYVDGEPEKRPKTVFA